MSVQTSAAGGWATLLLALPLDLPQSNPKRHWRAIAATRATQRRSVSIVLGPPIRGWASHLEQGRLLKITLTRVMGYRQRDYDDDNLRAAFKSVRDEVAKQLGRNDGRRDWKGAGIDWEYRQTRLEDGKPGIAVRIEAAP